MIFKNKCKVFLISFLFIFCDLHAAIPGFETLVACLRSVRTGCSSSSFFLFKLFTRNRYPVVFGETTTRNSSGFSKNNNQREQKPESSKDPESPLLTVPTSQEKPDFISRLISRWLRVPKSVIDYISPITRHGMSTEFESTKPKIEKEIAETKAQLLQQYAVLSEEQKKINNDTKLTQEEAKKLNLEISEKLKNVREQLKGVDREFGKNTQRLISLKEDAENKIKQIDPKAVSERWSQQKKEIEAQIAETKKLIKTNFEEYKKERNQQIATFLLVISEAKEKIEEEWKKKQEAEKVERQLSIQNMKALNEVAVRTNISILEQLSFFDVQSNAQREVDQGKFQELNTLLRKNSSIMTTLISKHGLSTQSSPALSTNQSVFLTKSLVSPAEIDD